MTKVLLLLLLCLTYHATAAIILTPVTFTTDPAPTPTPTPTPAPAPVPTSNTVSTDPIPEPVAPKDQAAPSSDATPQQGVTPIPADNGIIIVPEGPIPSVVPQTNPSPSNEDENHNHLDYSSRYEQISSEKKNKDKKDKPDVGSKKSKSKSKRQLLVNPDRSIVLMKEFPRNNAILPNSNVESAEKTIVLEEAGQFELTFDIHTVAAQVSEAIQELTLIVTLNGKETEIPLTSGAAQKQSVVLDGEVGPNQLVFSLQGKGKGKGLVSVVLNQFKVA